MAQTEISKETRHERGLREEEETSSDITTTTISRAILVPRVTEGQSIPRIQRQVGEDIMERDEIKVFCVHHLDTTSFQSLTVTFLTDKQAFLIKRGGLINHVSSPSDFIPRDQDLPPIIIRTS